MDEQERFSILMDAAEMAMMASTGASGPITYRLDDRSCTREEYWTAMFEKVKMGGR